MEKNKKHKIMVYGTLRQEDKPTHSLQGYDMYNYYNKFPYIVQGNGTVFGNLLTVDDAELKQLDRYEGVDRGLYTREEVEVVDMSTDKELWAYVYVAKDIAPERIASGDWADAS